MRPANIQQAKRDMMHLLVRKIKGKKTTRVKEHTQRAQQIAVEVYMRFQVGPYQYQVKHLRWYLETQTEHLKPATRYRHWLTVREIVCALGKDSSWMSLLRGEWAKPKVDT